MEEIADTATNAWLNMLHKIANEGETQRCSNVNGTSETQEILNNTATFDMNYPVIQHPMRKINYRFMAAEAYFIISGDNRVENLAQYNANVGQFSDDGLIFNGAYGPPFNNQLFYLTHVLRDNQDSRQAVCTIWKPNPAESKDVRCTLTLQFMIRGDKIHTFVNMRSSDIIHGITYDFFVFTMMTIRVLTYLNLHRDEQLELGNLYFNAASSHLYKRHYELARDILNYPGALDPTIKIPSYLLNDWGSCTAYLNAIKQKGKEAA